MPDLLIAARTIRSAGATPAQSAGPSRSTVTTSAPSPRDGAAVVLAKPRAHDTAVALQDRGGLLHEVDRDGESRSSSLTAWEIGATTGAAREEAGVPAGASSVAEVLTGASAAGRVFSTAHVFTSAYAAGEIAAAASATSTSRCNDCFTLSVAQRLDRAAPRAAQHA